jgi:hypothetical protein
MQPHLVGLLLSFAEDYAPDGEAKMNRERIFTYGEFLTQRENQSGALNTYFLN